MERGHGRGGGHQQGRAGEGYRQSTWEQQARAIPPLLASSPIICDSEFKMRSNDCL